MPPKTSKPAARKANPKKKPANGYQLPDPIPNGEIFTDVQKKKWQVGPSIGVGGFGEIYSASDIIASPKKNPTNPYAIKIEPHGNGPLFVEMHVYMRLGKEDMISEWKKQKKLSHLGMPRFISSGSHECGGTKYRFIVMDRFSKDIWSLFIQNNRVFPCDTVIKLGYQVLNTLEYFHSKSYVHADIKGANMLLGLKKGTENHVFLVDLGLATTFSKDYKPDPKKAHNGTPEYTSRDAHIGVPSMRGDLEILGYNMLQWLCSKLPWEDKLADPIALQKQKIQFMEDIPGNLKKCFGHTTTSPPAFLVKYFQHIAKLAIDEVPDYNYCCKLFTDGLKSCSSSLEGKMVFTTRKKTPVKAATTDHKKARKTKMDSDSDDTIDASPPKRSRKNGSESGKKVLGRSRKPVLIESSSEGEASSGAESEDEYEAIPRKAVTTTSKAKVAAKPSWRDCPTAIASKVQRPGEYQAISNGGKARKKKLP